MTSNAKNPLKTGQRCIICYAWEIYLSNDKSPKFVKIEHENYCPDYKRKK